MSNIIGYLGCGTLWVGSSYPGAVIIVRRLPDISKIIIPLFSKHPLHGTKNKDFLDFCRIADMMNKKEHLTLKGLQLIREIKAGMNTGRKV